jgi:hypothetical protein
MGRYAGKSDTIAIFPRPPAIEFRELAGGSESVPGIVEQHSIVFLNRILVQHGSDCATIESIIDHPLGFDGHEFFDFPKQLCEFAEIGAERLASLLILRVRD